MYKIKTKVNFLPQDPITKLKMSRLIFENATIQEISKENSKEKFDILHTHYQTTGGAFVSKYVHEIPWINTFHSLEKKRIKYLAKEERKYFDIIQWSESTIKYADALITVSEKLKLEILQNYPFKQEKIFYIPNGVDLSVFKPEKTPLKDKKVLYVGRFSLEKSIDLIPKIIRKTFEKNNEVKFELVAQYQNIPSSMEKIGKELEDLLEQYPERIIWHKEPLSREELSKLYHECLIYIQPSRYEAFGLTILEAMACGKAVICSNKGGIPGLVENAGIILPLNSGLFVKNILKLLEDYKLRERYGRRAVERAKLFGWDGIALKTLKLYKKVAEKEKNKIGT